MQEAKSKDKTRLNLELGTGVRNSLEDLTKKVGAASLTEVIRRALALYHMTADHIHQGGKVIFVSADGRHREKLKILL